MFNIFIGLASAIYVMAAGVYLDHGYVPQPTNVGEPAVYCDEQRRGDRAWKYNTACAENWGEVIPK